MENKNHSNANNKSRNFIQNSKISNCEFQNDVFVGLFWRRTKTGGFLLTVC